MRAPESQHKMPLKEGITYHVTYGNGGWKSRMDDGSAKALAEMVTDRFKKHRFREQHFIDALDACYDRFVHDRSPATLPWREHLVATKSLKKRESLLKQKAETPWDLDWYWRVFIMSSNQWLDSCVAEGTKRVFLRLSQVRQWVLLTVFKKEGSNRRTLLTEPIFGKSNRLVEWDQYWLYLLNAEKICREYQHYMGADATERAYVVGRHDVDYELDLADLHILGKTRIKVTLRGTLNPAPYILAPAVKGGREKRIVARERARWDPRTLVTFPVLDLKGGDKKEMKLLLASDRVCEALEQLSDIWNDPTSEIVHLNAPPGSGKEILAKTIRKCRSRRGYEAIVSLSPYDSAENAHLLLGRPKDCSGVAATEAADVRPNQEKTGVMLSRTNCESLFEAGFIEETKNGVLVLDEIDKVQAETRTNLLRVLESKKFLVPGTNIPRDVEKVAPLYLLLTSKPMVEVYGSEPRDFWTRIACTIRMEHPLDIKEGAEREAVLGAYCWMFWNRHLKEYREALEKKPQTKEAQQTPAGRLISNYIERVVDFLGSKALVSIVTATMASEIQKRFTDISVRNLRGITRRGFFKLIEWVMYPRRSWQSNEQAHKLHRQLARIIYTGKAELLGSDRSGELRRIIEMIAESAVERRVEYPG